MRRAGQRQRSRRLPQRQGQPADLGSLAGPGPAGDAVKSVVPHRPTDAGIDVPRAENARTAIQRQHGDAGLGADIQPFGLGQQAAGQARDPRIGRRVGQKAGRLQAFVPQPVTRQVQPPCPRIFAHIARDIGQLHRQTQVAGAGQRIGIAHLHQHAHHRPYRSGNAGRIIHHA